MATLHKNIAEIEIYLETCFPQALIAKNIRTKIITIKNIINNPLSSPPPQLQSPLYNKYNNLSPILL